MKKETVGRIFTILIVGMLLAGQAHAQSSGASTMTLFPTSITAKAGETFDLKIQVNPNGELLDTVRAILTFTPTILEVEDVALTGAFDRVSPGNSVENSQGILSFGGFTLQGPVTQSTEFAQVTFRALAEGEGEINISPSSRLISNGEETINLTLLGEVSVTIVSGDVPVSGSVKIESLTHSDQESWYNNPIAELVWSVEGGEGEVDEYLFALDQSSATTPTQSLSATVTSYTTQELTDGIWYVHVRSKLTSGGLTPTTHRAIRVDRTPPNPWEIDLTTDQIIENESLQAFFGTTDETSGVAKYELSLNGSDYASVTSPQTFQNLPPGTYVVQMRAVDKAGNETYAQAVFRSYPEGSVLPTRPSSEAEEGKRFGVRELLITLAFGILLVIGIIYRTIMLRKKKNSSPS